MTTKLMYEFLILSKTLNYRKAASVLFISQPTLSRHMYDLEEEMGATLLVRDSHQVALTKAGQRLALQAEKFIDECAAARDLLRLSEFPINGQIRIGCSPEIGQSSHVRVFISRFLEKYPQINVQVDILPNGLPQSVTEAYDFVFSFCEYVALPPTIHVHMLGNHSCYLAVSSRNPLMAQSIVSLHELKGETVIVPFINELFGPYAKNWRLVESATRGQAHCISAINVQTMLFLVSIGKGIALIPRYARQNIIGDTFVLGIRNTECCFTEYIYYNSAEKNDTARLFYEEYCSMYGLVRQT